MKNSIFTYLIIAMLLLSSPFAYTQETGGSYYSDTIHATITPAQAFDTIAAHANDAYFVILDVRMANENSTNHMSEGVNMDYYQSFSSTVSALDKHKIYLVHCASGARSLQAYNIMVSLGFTVVYNMSGGLSSWMTSGFPVTTGVSPEIGLLTDSICNFDTISPGDSDTIQLKITNAANSILSFNSITDLFGTDFSTDFALDTSLSGSRDYTFNVFYHPSDLGADSAILHIESNGGSLYLYLFGKTFTTTSANNNGVQNGSIVYNNHSKTIQLANLCSEGQYKLYDILGNVRMEGIVTDSYQTISCEHLSKGLYVFSLYQNGHKTNIKFFL